MTKRTPGAIDTLRRLAADGCLTSHIAREIGVSGQCIANWASEEGIALLSRSQAMKKLNADPAFAAARDERGRERMKKLHADPAFAAAQRERMKKLNADPAFAAAQRERMKKLNADPAFAAALKAARKGAKGVQIPFWVPEDLHDEFLELAAKQGEEDAARHVRRLKAEMRVLA